MVIDLSVISHPADAAQSSIDDLKEVKNRTITHFTFSWCKVCLTDLFFKCKLHLCYKGLSCIQLVAATEACMTTLCTCFYTEDNNFHLDNFHVFKTMKELLVKLWALAMLAF